MRRLLIDSVTRFLWWTKRHRRRLPVLPRLNIGCGLHSHGEWLNVDGSLNAWIGQSWPRWTHGWWWRVSGARTFYTKTQYCARLRDRWVHADVTYGLPFHDRAVAHIYCSYLLEHLTSAQGFAFLRDCKRVLSLNGLLRIVVPDLAHATEELQGDAFARYHALSYYFFNEQTTHYAPHRWMYNQDSLSTLLKDIGFREIRRCPPFDGDTPDLKELEHDDHGMLILEARA